MKLFLRYLALFIKNFTLPGFDKVPLIYVFRFFWKALLDYDFSIRVAALSFKFFTALIPAVVVLFTLIPYLPIPNFQAKLLELIKSILPGSAYEVFEQSITDTIVNQHANLLSISFLISLVLATNGIEGMISAFNSSIHIENTKTYIYQWFHSFLVLIILTICFLLGITVIFTFEYGMYVWLNGHFLVPEWLLVLQDTGRWILIFFFFFSMISLVYYLCNYQKEKWQLFSVGAFVATILSVVVSAAFAYYVNYITDYNKIYGTLGTLMVLVFWIYLNNYALVIGFELNASIKQAKKEKIKLV